jgi:apolipoprotein N-acyltransferase
MSKIREHQKESIRTYHRLTMEAAETQPDLIVWPESVVPGDVIGDVNVRKWMGAVARTTHAHMLVGGPRNFQNRKGGPISQMNGVHMFSPQGELLGSYFKVRLVPFAEFIPHRKLLRLLGRQPFRETDVIAAREHKLIPSPFGKIGAVICFESVFPGIARRETRDGAEILFVLTNDSWFQKTAAALQHYNHSILRAVENRRYVVRSGCSGVSSVVDPYGRVTDKLDMWEQGVLLGEVQALSGLTFYSRYGDWFAYFSVVLATLGLLTGIARRRATA